MKSLISLSGFVALASALSPPYYRPFKLRAEPSYHPLASHGFLGQNGQTLQWGTNITSEYTAFYDESTKTVNSTSGSGIMYLRPTHGTPMYYVFSGNPQSDPTPALTVSTWQLRTTSDGKTWLGPPSFLGCPSSPKGPSNIFLYFGPAVTSRCGSNFALEVVYQDEPEPTVTVTETVSSTATETATETETCTTDEPEPTETETCTTDEPEPTSTETCIEEPTETVTETETCTTDEPVEPTGTGTQLPPPGTNTTVTKPPVPTETGDEPPVSAAAGIKSSSGGMLALVIAGGLAVWIL